ncbi:MAG: FHA domain-containing protein [Candidatus Brocadiae bacterium]|nr:FHA domain-containing protein [Candidatus Brocadiia bacterium]
MTNHLTAITFKDIAKLTQPRNTYLDILLFDEQQVKEKISNSKPIVKVVLTRMEPRQKYFLDSRRFMPVLESLHYTEWIVIEKFLYDLSDIGRAMCLAVGRFNHNHLRPFLSEDQGDMDPFVSREHGLIFVNEKRQICYHDIGTFKKGSTNGTKLNDLSLVKNEIITWNAHEYFGLGESLNIVKTKERVMESKFKLRFQEIL